MKQLTALTLSTILVALAGCASPSRAPAPAQPQAQRPTYVQTAAPVAPRTPSGERVIKVIRLPKGQTPYDLPKTESVPDCSATPVSIYRPVYRPVCEPCVGGLCGAPR